MMINIDIEEIPSTSQQGNLTTSRLEESGEDTGGKRQQSLYI